jgi:hypothetical protein
VLDVMTRTLGEEHAGTLTVADNLALTLGAQGDHVRARQIQERVLEMMTRTLGEEHPERWYDRGRWRLVQRGICDDRQASFPVPSPGSS